ncbi:Uncharacterized protein conserved in bacteria [Raoultella terrigena]|uniref:Uncharacterized protein conserved in bacteria n=1 Tax=Raoultella terrigena TaxID=577 RepID=A0A4U9CV63_RAOTE|nr:Uncharacterized protein conserved in bacteria [Raoultella terrigena]
MHISAEQKLSLVSASDMLFAGKKKVTLIGGGSYLIIEGGKIEYGTDTTYTRKVKRTHLTGNISQEVRFDSFSVAKDLVREGFYDEQFRVLTNDGKPLQNVPYLITNTQGETFKGATDSQGLCDRVFTKDISTLTIYLGIQALEKWNV